MGKIKDFFAASIGFYPRFVLYGRVEGYRKIWRIDDFATRHEAYEEALRRNLYNVEIKHEYVLKD